MLKIWKLYSLSKFANFLIVLRAQIVTIFEPKVVTISARNTISNEKICKLCKAIFSTQYNIFNQILEFYF